MKKILLFCAIGLLGNQFLNAQCADQAVTVLPTTAICTATPTVTIANSEVGSIYWVRDNSDNTIIDGPFDGTGSSIDINLDEIMGSTTYQVLVTKGTSLDFDGTLDNLTIAPNASLDFTGDFTIEAILKETGTGLQAIYSQFEGTTNQKRLEFQVLGSNQLQVVLSDDGITNTHTATSVETLELNEWNHCAVVFEAGVGVTFYINGEVATATTSGPVPASIFATSSITTIGASRQGAQNFFTGQLEELRVWNDVRTNFEIEEDVIETLSGTEGNLVANWSFENGTGSAISTDKTANANTATLNSMDPATDWVNGLFGTCENIMTNTPAVTITIPEMDVQGNATSIASGDISPEDADHTDFGLINFGNFFERTFTIENTGDEDITLTGAPLIQITNSTDFTITVDPAVTIAASGGTTTFTVRYTPSQAGTINTATLSLANNDCDENPYEFDVTGESDAPLGIEENEDFNIRIMPNPNDGLFTINYSGNNAMAHLNLIDVLGNFIQKIELNDTSNQRIDLRHLAKGLYLIELVGDNGKKTKRLIIK